MRDGIYRIFKLNHLPITSNFSNLRRGRVDPISRGIRTESTQGKCRITFPLPSLLWLDRETIWEKRRIQFGEYRVATSETSNVGHYLVAIVTHWRGPGSQLLYVYTLPPSSFLLFPPRRLHQRLKLETISRDIQIIMPLGYNGRSIGVHRGGTSK